MVVLLSFASGQMKSSVTLYVEMDDPLERKAVYRRVGKLLREADSVMIVLAEDKVERFTCPEKAHEWTMSVLEEKMKAAQ
ncbi:hypothetical protein [Vibrio barjaei]|uniref:hypothetical protein n=1 Tax=Vibrio barjaei TaxID=1676683 RepID=UPI0022842054|nr:hypothetical protein [Vibrio barjaei]MCY9874028.1 hypothetical protein [Vibrio barjaei]